jgi:hypothetical protein
MLRAFLQHLALYTNQCVGLFVHPKDAGKTEKNLHPKSILIYIQKGAKFAPYFISKCRRQADSIKMMK